MAYNVQRRYAPAYKAYPSNIILRKNVELLEDLEYQSIATSEYEFSFNNETKEFSDNNVDWDSSGQSRHWRKSLHSFDYLHDPNRSFSTKFHLINHWIVNTIQKVKPEMPGILMSLLPEFVTGSSLF